MHLRDVEIFCDIVSLHSFSKAADRQKVSQSSASQAVHHLEKHLGVKLIDRSQRPWELTAAGHVYYEGCRDLLGSLRTIEDQVQQRCHRVMGRVRVAAIYSVGLLEMDVYVKRFRQDYPDVDLQVNYLHPDEVYARVVGDEADIGLVSFPRDGGEIGCVHWQQQEMVLVTSVDHPLADEESVPLKAISGEDFIGFTSELTIRRKIDRWLRESRVSVNIVHQFDNIENIKRAVEIGSGVAILPAPTLRRELMAGTLRARTFDDVHWFRPLGIVHRRHKTFTTATGKFIDVLHETDLDLPGDDSLPSNLNGSGDESTGRSPDHRQTASKHSA